MSAPNISRWIGIGLLGLPLYGVLTFFSGIDPQPDPNTHYEAWSRFVTTNHYVLGHLLGSILGLIFLIFGVFALGVYLATSRAGRLGLVAMVITVVGQALGLTIGGVTAFATNAIGRAYLAGIKDVMQVEFATEMTVTLGLTILLLFVGNLLLGIAVWRSGTLPKWAGAIWVASALMFYVLGAVAGMLTTGASLPTQPVGGLLIAISGGWIAWSVLRRPSAEAVGVGAEPRVQ